jgi:cytochrome c oxidase assembly factor CtaG
MLFQKRVCEHTKLDFYISFNTILFSILEEEKNPTNLQNSQILARGFFNPWVIVRRLLNKTHFHTYIKRYVETFGTMYRGSEMNKIF